MTNKKEHQKNSEYDLEFSREACPAPKQGTGMRETEYNVGHSKATH